MMERSDNETDVSTSYIHMFPADRRYVSSLHTTAEFSSPSTDRSSSSFSVCEAIDAQGKLPYEDLFTMRGALVCSDTRKARVGSVPTFQPCNL